MKRTLILLVLSGVLTPMMNTQPALASNVRRCAFNDINPDVSWTDWEVERTIACTARKFGVSVSTALYVANRESRLNEWAWNDYSDAAGLYQHLIRYWPARADAFPDWQRWMKIRSDRWNNPRIQALVTMKMVQQGGWGPWSM